MKDVFSKLRSLKRPPILIQAARIGLATYNRTTDIHRYLGYQPNVSRIQLIQMLLEDEHMLNQRRKDGAASYAVTDHVNILTAILSEAKGLWHVEQASSEQKKRRT